MRRRDATSSAVSRSPTESAVLCAESAEYDGAFILGFDESASSIPVYDPERLKPAMKFWLSKRVGRGAPRPSRKARVGWPPKLVRRECGSAPGMVRIEGESYARMLRRPRPRPA